MFNLVIKMDEGNIYDANISSINKSNNTEIGEIHASITNKELGEINKNEINTITSFNIPFIKCISP